MFRYFPLRSMQTWIILPRTENDVKWCAAFEAKCHAKKYRLFIAAIIADIRRDPRESCHVGKHRKNFAANWVHDVGIVSGRKDDERTFSLPLARSRWGKKGTKTQLTNYTANDTSRAHPKTIGCGKFSLSRGFNFMRISRGLKSFSYSAEFLKLQGWSWAWRDKRRCCKQVAPRHARNFSGISGTVFCIFLKKRGELSNNL